MNILSLNINDLKRITAIEISPTTGKPVILTGDNGNGKSSVLDSILLALTNSGLDDPIRHGRPSGTVKLTLGTDKAEYLLERKVTKSGDKLTLTDANGIAVQKPQTFLNGLLGNYAFDPLEFVRLKPKDQVEALKVAAGLDFTAIDAKRAEHYSERTIITRDGKETAAQLAAIPAPAEGLPAEEVSAVDLVGKLRVLEDAERKVSAVMADAEIASVNHATALQAVARIEAQLVEAKEFATEKEKLNREASAAFEAAKSSSPTAEVIQAAREAIAQADETNKAVRNAAAHKALDAKLKDLRLKLANLNRRIEEIDEEKKSAIQNANLPLDGLELTDEGVMVSGTFFSQLSTAEQIRVSTLVAMSQNPELKIIIIREGALMNSANLAMIAKMAEEKGFQCWIERFQESPSAEGLHIIDGSIAFEDGEPVTTPAE
jgi:hypothetical protein